MVKSLFSKKDCTSLLNKKIKNQFYSANTHYPTNYRNNQRNVVDDFNLAKKLFRKVSPFLPKKIKNSEGSWYLKQLNPRLRYCKYSKDQYFNRHLDGVYFQNKISKSKLTFMIYLNDSKEFKGGKTLFYKKKDSKKIWASYIPKQGDLIIFENSIWHEGEKVLNGEKFVLRSDIIYKKKSLFSR